VEKRKEIFEKLQNINKNKLKAKPSSKPQSSKNISMQIPKSIFFILLLKINYR